MQCHIERDKIAKPLSGCRIMAVFPVIWMERYRRIFQQYLGMLWISFGNELFFCALWASDIVSLGMIDWKAAAMKWCLS
jgi:hypothetical protein